MKKMLESFGFSQEEILALNEVATRKLMPPKTIFFNGDRSFDKLYYISKGCIRCFRVINGEDYTYFFFFDQEFAVDYESFLTENDSSLSFETLEETEVIILDRSDIYRLYGEYPKFEKLGRLMAERAYLSAASRLKQHQTDDLKTRYLNLLNKNPRLIQAVPQHYIASYLGVKPQSLSRIKAEISGKQY
jgi:CRP-like cAMP-binding protein